jgi:Flp pilus assembly pilin Flp
VSILRPLIQKFRNREDGQTLVEYSLIISLIAITAIGGMAVMGGDVQGLYALFETASSWLSGGGGA